ncbi:MAG: hypothetical protein JWN11_1031 [Hyphomicrobiales bacterium]|nr:hypothetical protein [Hyphomicrobiales bacterium]
MIDRRIRKTQEALYSALVALIVTKGYEATTVQDVLDSADVGRSTFYARFPSKEALLEFGFERLRQELDKHMANRGPERFSFLRPLLLHAKAHAGLYAALLDGTGGRLVEARLSTLIADLIRRDLDRLGADPGDDAVAFLTGGLLETMAVWAKAGARGNIEAIHGTFSAAAAGLMSTPQ